jgi:hypothetical protein
MALCNLCNWVVVVRPHWLAAVNEGLSGGGHPVGPANATNSRLQEREEEGEDSTPVRGALYEPGPSLRMRVSRAKIESETSADTKRFSLVDSDPTTVSSPTTNIHK